MARAQAEAPPAEEHRAGQAALVALVVRAVLHAWASLLDPHDLKGTTPRLIAAVEAIVKHYGAASASAALNEYRTQRHAAGVTGRPTLHMPTPPSRDDVAGLVEHALSPLYGPVTPEIEQKVRDALASEVEQMVLDQSRAAIIGATQVDPQAKGWARVTEPGACSFCRLLATRGAVYRTASSADFRAHTKQPNGSGGTCRCHVEPVFKAYEMTAQARIDRAAYDRLAEEYGHSGRDILIAWRQHVEGRAVTGPTVKPYHHGDRRTRDELADEGRGNHGGSGQPLGFEHLTVDQLENQLSVLRGLKESDYKRKQMARITKRLAELRK